MKRTTVEAAVAIRNGKVVAELSPDEVEGVSESEGAGMASSGGGALSMDQNLIPRLDEYQGSFLYARVGVKGVDVIYHVDAENLPDEDTFRGILAEVFMDTIGSIQGVEASLVDTHEFEEKPSFWAIRALGWAVNPLARPKLIEELLPALEKRLES